MKDLIAVVGANGTVGGRVADLVLGQGLRVRAVVRDTASAQPLAGAGAELARADILTDDLAGAFDGATGAFLMVPVHPQMAEMGTRLNEAAEAAGVQRAVRLSVNPVVIETEGPFGRVHADLDRDLLGRDLAAAVLRPKGFMQNFLGQAQAIRAGRLVNAAGEGRTAFIDADDIAASAAALLAGDRPREGVFELTGPEALTYAEAAAVFSDVLGHAVAYEDVPVEAFLATLRGHGAPAFTVEAVGELVRRTREETDGRVTDAVEVLTGRAPRALRAWVEANRAAFEA